MSKRNVNKTLISRQTLAVGVNTSKPLYIGESTARVQPCLFKLFGKAAPQQKWFYRPATIVV